MTTTDYLLGKIENKKSKMDNLAVKILAKFAL